MVLQAKRLLLTVKFIERNNVDEEVRPRGLWVDRSILTLWTIWWCHLRGSDLAELVEEIGASASRPVIPIRRLDRAVALTA